MNKTEHFALNKPEPQDPIRLSDLNANADLIDAALAVLGGERVVVGSYEGDGTKDRLIELPFTPKLVIQLGYINSSGGISIVTPEVTYYTTGESCGSTANAHIVENGFKTAVTYAVWHNISGKTEHYVAIR